MKKAKTKTTRKDSTMSEFIKNASNAGEQYLTALADGQEQFLKAMSSYTSLLPKVPVAPIPAFATELPTPKEIVEANFTFAAKLLKQQKEFTEKLFAASTAN
jgi:hypothetical protein